MLASILFILSWTNAASQHVYSDNYIFVNLYMDYADANSYCMTHFSTTLATIHSASENKEAAKLCDSNHQIGFCRIGLDDIESENEWVWQDRSIFDYATWSPGEPNNVGEEDCAEIFYRNNEPFWNDVWCTKEVLFLCNRRPPTTNPTTYPTIQPSESPTIAPTHFPSQSPSQSPTQYPSISPSSSPSSFPSFSPSQSPTTSPSQPPTNPTSNPTTQPTKDPTHDPTHDPTQDPTIDPTQDPTTEPTLEPTQDPSQAPSNSPSFTPSNAPSASPTLSPTASPSTEAELLKLYVDKETYVDEINVALYGTLFVVPATCIGASVIIYKYDRIYGWVKSFFFRVDNQAYLSVILYFVQMTDMSSDLCFVYQLWCYDHEMKYGDIAVRENVDDSTKKTIHILFVFALTFTVFPYLLNFFSSIRIISSIASDDTINEYTKGYFKRNDKAYSVYTLLSGGSFYTLKLINSNFFGLRVFQAGMSQMMVEKYATHKIVLTTLLENVPQLVIQSAFVIKLRMVSKTVIVASLSSVFNILLSIMSASVINSTHQNEVEMLFKINISWEKKKESDDDVDVDPFAMTGQRKKLSKALSDLERTNAFEFEILSSQKKEKGSTVYGVAKCDQKCPRKEENIRLFFEEYLRDAVMTSFGYNEAVFDDVFSFDLNFVIGALNECVYSEEAKEYLPMIWSFIPWDTIKKAEKRINDDVIINLTQEIKSLNGSNQLLEVEEEKENNESDVDVEEIDIIIHSEMVPLKKDD